MWQPKAAARTATARPTRPVLHPHAAETPRERDRARLRVEHPLPVAHEAVAGAQVAAGRDQQAQGQVGHVLGQGTQGGRDGQAALAAIRQVHRVGAHAIDRHHPQVRQALQQHARDAGVAPRDHGLDRIAVRAQPGLRVRQFEEPVDLVQRPELVVDRRDQDRIELQDGGFHGRWRGVVSKWAHGSDELI
jgi:hypothetical protein